MKRLFSVTHTIRQTEIPAWLFSLITNTFCQNVVSTEKISCPHILVKNSMLNFWSTEDWSSFLSPAKLSYHWVTTNCCSVSDIILSSCICQCRSQWPRGLRGGSVAARLLGLRFRIPPGALMSVVSVVCCQVQVSASGLSLVQRSPTDCGVPECDREASIMRPWPTGGCGAMVKSVI
jgi:hypothetical protein